MKNTVENKVEILLAVVISLFITLLCFYWLKADFSSQRKKLIFTASHSFLKAIDAEKAIKLEEVKLHEFYSSDLSPDKIPSSEKKNWCDQSFFIKHDSTRHTLDRLFRVELAKQDLSVQVAIKCLIEGKTVYSNPDNLFYQQATVLPPVVYRLNEKPEGRCELQGYVKLPLLVVLKQMHFGGIILFFWILSLLAVVGAFRYSRKKRIIEPVSMPTAAPVVEEPVATVAPVVAERIVPLIAPTVAWTRLRDDVLFDKKHGVVKYKDCIIELGNNRLLLFRLFLSAPYFHVTTADLCGPLLGRNKVEELTKSDRDAIATNIKRLRENLASCPLEIINIRGNGYQLKMDLDKADPKDEQPSNDKPEAIPPK